MIKNRTFDKLLGVKIGNKLSFDKRVKNIFKSVNSKLRALARTTPYMDIGKRNFLLNAFFNEQLNYCPLIWMLLHSHCNNNKIKFLHERCLRLIYNDKHSSYKEFLQKDGPISIHHKNIQDVTWEVNNALAPKTVKYILTKSCGNSIRNDASAFVLPEVLNFVSFYFLFIIHFNF